MKTCKNARNCEWGNCYKPNECAYKENMTEYDRCPKALRNLEDILVKIVNEENNEEINRNV